jgi:hypothetical protein
MSTSFIASHHALHVLLEAALNYVVPDSLLAVSSVMFEAVLIKYVVSDSLPSTTHSHDSKFMRFVI